MYLNDYFSIEIYPLLKKNQSSLPQQIPRGIRYFDPLLPRSYFRRILLGLFNFSPIQIFLKDLFTVFRSKDPIYSLKEWFLYMVTYRAVYANKRFRSAIKGSDIVYFYWGNFPISLIAGNNNLFVRVHGGEVNFERHKGYIPSIRQKILAKGVVYLPISEDAYRRIHLVNKDAVCILSRLGVVYKGRNPRPSDDASIRIVSCSNVIGLKRLHLIIQALKQISDITIKWTHFGDGNLLDKIKEQATQLPRNIAVEFRGRVDNQEVLEFYRAVPIDLFVNVSETEGVPVSIMEALSFGIPCFATDVGGTSEILNGIGGKVVPKDFEIVELSKYICEIRDVAQYKDLRNGAFSLWKERCVADENYKLLLKTFSE